MMRFLIVSLTALCFADPRASLLFPRNDDIVSHESTILAVLVSDFRMPQQGSLVVELNGHDIGRQTPPPDEDGNANINIAVPSLPPGLHTVRVSLRDMNDEPIGDADEVEFLVEYREDGEIDALEENSSESDLEDSCEGLGPNEKPFCKMGNSNECSGHGSCKSGICLCDAGFVGDKCEHEIFEDPVYFPEIDPRLSPSRCIQASHFARYQPDLLRDLERIHALDMCKPERVNVYGTRFHGFGAQMHFLTVALNDAYRNKKGLVMAGNWTYSMHDGCDPKGHLCHFEAHFPFCDNGVLAEGREVAHHPPADSHYVPEKYKNMGVMWYRSQLANFLLRPNPTLEQRIRMVKAAIGWPAGPVIGVHVRRGDSCNHAEISDFKPKCHGFEEHAHYIDLFSRRYGTEYFFLATDSQQTVDLALEFAKARGLKMLYVNFDRTIFEGRWFLEFKMHHGIVDRRMVSESAILDMFLLAECDSLTGALSGQLTRLALELMVLKKGFVPPYASLDYPWCFHFMEKSRVGNFGDKNC